MKLLFVSRHFPNIFGGVSDYTYHLSKALSERGVEVCVLTSKDENVITGAEYNVKVLPLIGRWGFMGLPRVISEIRKANPDLVLLQYVPYTYSHYGIPVYIALLSILLHILRFKLVTTFHEIAIRLDFKEPKYLGIAILQRLIAYTVCVASDKIIVSIEHYRKMLGIFDKKIHRIPVGSNIPPVDVSDRVREELRREMAPSGEIIISTFGANPRRSDLLLEVIKRLKEGNFSVKFLFIGGFPKDWVEGIKVKAKDLKIDDAIYFTGFLKPEDVYRYLLTSDIFVIFESVNGREWGGISTKSTSLAAAYSAGLSIIGNKGDMTDDFFNKGNIVLINSLGEEVIFKEISNMISNPVLMENLKRGAAETFERKLSWPVIAKRYMEVCV